MKKFLFILLLFAALSASAQKRDTVITDSTNFINATHLAGFVKYCQHNLVFDEYKKFYDGLIEMIRKAEAEFKIKNQNRKQ